MRCSPPKSSRTMTGTEYEKAVQEDAAILMEEEVAFSSPVIVQRPIEEPISDGLVKSGRASGSVQKNDQRERQDIDIENDVDSGDKGPERQFQKRRQSRSPPKRMMDDRNRGKNGGRIDSVRNGLSSDQRFDQRSRSRSPTRNWRRSPYADDYRSSGYRSSNRNQSRSPRRGRKSHEEKSVHQVPEYDEDTTVTDHFPREYRTSMRSSSMDRRRSQRYDSPSPENYRGHSRSLSPLYDRRPRKRSQTPESPRSPQRMSRDMQDSRRRSQSMGFTSVKEKPRLDTSPTTGRRERRHEQTTREDNMVNRQKDGRKAFYLTLDPEGKPYGPGKPAWVAEISKLASGLDPSCTHMRKQTYDSIQIFKDRLNENFEYSGKLNEDYLRGLMGKAMTKKRGELISLIKNGGKQPLTTDRQVWRRLEKLAYSRQREEKSEQGRYANSCRKTLGRTGARGVNGIRKKLRSVLRRSPHPEEVEEEMERDKGFGGQKRKKSIVSCKRDRDSIEVISSDEDRRSQSPGKNSDGHSSDTSDSEQYRGHAKKVSKRIGRRIEYSVHDMNDSPRKANVAQQSYSISNAQNLSKDEFIESLKAEIERLQAGKGEASTSNTLVPSRSGMSTPYSGSERRERGNVDA